MAFSLQRKKPPEPATEERMDPPSADELADHVILLFEQYHIPVFNYIRQLTGDSEWANDLTQETFLRLFQSRQRLPQVKNQRAWLYRIASNATFTALKKRRRFRWLPWQDDADTRLQTADQTNQFAQQDAVQQALKQLPPIYRAVLILYSQYDLSIRELADILDISESNAKVRLHRARKLFQAAYLQE